MTEQRKIPVDPETAHRMSEKAVPDSIERFIATLSSGFLTLTNSVQDNARAVRELTDTLREFLERSDWALGTNETLVGPDEEEDPDSDDPTIFGRGSGEGR